MSRMRLASRRYRSLLNPFPNTKLVRHKYCDVVQVPASVAAGSPVVYVFRANSTWDPDFTGIGHQPMFRDEMAAQYRYYTVLNSKITFTFAPGDGNERRISCFTDDDPNPSFATRYSNEESHYTVPMVKFDKRNTPFKIGAWYDAAKWKRSTRSALMADNDEKVPVGSDPPSASSTVKYFILYMAPVTGGDSLSAVNAHVTLYQTVIWREPVDHTPS